MRIYKYEALIKKENQSYTILLILSVSSYSNMPQQAQLTWAFKATGRSIHQPPIQWVQEVTGQLNSFLSLDLSCAEFQSTHTNKQQSTCL